IQVEKLQRLIMDGEYRETALRHGLERASHFSWDATAYACVTVYTDVLR
ncbi:MAG: hypothetical protein RJA02_2220, partial [Armatimonadota bacterium]